MNSGEGRGEKICQGRRGRGTGGGGGRLRTLTAVVRASSPSIPSTLGGISGARDVLGAPGGAGGLEVGKREDARHKGRRARVHCRREEKRSEEMKKENESGGTGQGRLEGKEARNPPLGWSESGRGARRSSLNTAELRAARRPVERLRRLLRRLLMGAGAQPTATLACHSRRLSLRPLPAQSPPRPSRPTRSPWTFRALRRRHWRSCQRSSCTRCRRSPPPPATRPLTGTVREPTQCPQCDGGARFRGGKFRLTRPPRPCPRTLTCPRPLGLLYLLRCFY